MNFDNELDLLDGNVPDKQCPSTMGELTDVPNSPDPSQAHTNEMYHSANSWNFHYQWHSIPVQ
jgi:hypothetical protein